MNQQDKDRLEINQRLLVFLQKKKQDNPTIYFQTRKKNYKNRLSQGYWFTGAKNYVQISFWEGTDGIRKIYHIAFVVKQIRGVWRSLIHLSCKDNDELATLLRSLAEQLGGFQKGKGNLWERSYDDFDYLKNLESFIDHQKPIIDKVIRSSSQQYIQTVSQETYVACMNKLKTYQSVTSPNNMNGSIKKSQKTLEQPATLKAILKKAEPSSKELHPPNATEKHIVVAEGQSGISYDDLFGEYLREASSITVTDPYVRMFYQVRNFMEFMETVSKYAEKESKAAVHLVTGEDEYKPDQQRESFEKIKASAEMIGIQFTWEFSRKGIHARHIVTDLGWKILLDRGLDIFQHYEMRDTFSFDNRLQQYRPCKAFEITYIRQV